MRKLTVAAFAAAVIGSIALTSAPASAHCVTVTGSGYPLVTVAGPFGPTTVYAPGTIDTHPTGCVSMVTELVGDVEGT